MELHHRSEKEAPKKVTKLFLNSPLAWACGVSYRSQHGTGRNVVQIRPPTRNCPPASTDSIQYGHPEHLGGSSDAAILNADALARRHAECRVLAQTGPVGLVSQCPLIGVDRK